MHYNLQSVFLHLVEIIMHASSFSCASRSKINKFISISDVPNEPAEVGLMPGSANPTNVTISWADIPSSRPYISTTVDHFVVQLKTNRQTYFRPVATLPGGPQIPFLATATVTGLIPYSTYYIQVLAVNAAGSTPSVVLTVNTPTSG